jgi:hypothetical protein
MHVYVMKNWVCIQILLTLQHVEMGVMANNIIVIILWSMSMFGGLSQGTTCLLMGMSWL